MLFRRQVREYTVISKIGGGRYGVCYLAQDQTGRDVVLKRFRPRMLRKNLRNNYHEAVILSNLQHGAIPELLGVVNNRQGYFFILEYKPGDSLERQLFQQDRKFLDADIFRIGSQILDILLYLHHHGVVHRDISIANVLDDGKQVSLIDFGLARYMDGGRIDPALDYSCFGNLLLYLLYSTYHGKEKGAWYRVLPLSQDKKYYLMRLMGLAPRFKSTEEVRAQFDSAF